MPPFVIICFCFFYILVQLEENGELFMHDKTIQHNNSLSIVQVPDFCPHCGKVMELEQVDVKYDSTSDHYLLCARCSVDSCRKFFCLEYSSREDKYGQNFLHELIPYSYNGFQESNISERIIDLSPIFAETFSQANIAEGKNLNQVAGIGFRKAFEFLVKDFASYKNPDRIEEIRKNNVNNVINMFYKEMPKLAELLHITRKIGNDETHYYREYDNVDVKDLKKLITNFSLYIDMILNIEEYGKKTS